ncbi:MAG: DUF2442 domain-containing protein [Prevotellaceae bacterium]|jgi:hypothetical protein|nr:DUF2442 domain-containing protein [Prevotellaceae bacterium]
MNPRVKNVVPQKDYTVYLWFTNGEEGVFDMKPYLNKGIFRELQNISMFNSVRPFIGTIQWANEADICPDTVYLDSVKVPSMISTKPK